MIEMAEMKWALRLPGFAEQATIIAVMTAMAAIELVLPAWVYGAGPHVHGQAALEIAIDGAAVQINLNSPLDNLLGFEHSPRNEKERQVVRTMVTRLHQADNLFIFTPAAQCRLESARLESPTLAPNLLMPDSNNIGKSTPNSSNNGGMPKTSSHAPSSRAVPFRPAPSDDHAELEATWNFRCALPQALQGLDVRLFQVFPGLRRVDAAMAGPKGQSSARLSPASTRLKW